MAGDYIGLHTNADSTVSASDGYTVTPSDATTIPATVGIQVTVAGNLDVTWAKTGRRSTIPGLIAGVVYPYQVSQIWAASTTATGIYVLYN